MGFYEAIVKANDTVNSLVWGPPMLILIVGTGIFLTIMLKFMQVSKIKNWWKATFGFVFSRKIREKSADSNITPFQAVSTALASTVGTGNIVGVATAIVRGGPGAVFWMWVSAFFGMVTKYAEVVLAVKYREIDANGTHHGGPMYYIEKGLKMKWLAVIFAIFATFATFGIGNLTQANSIADSMNTSFKIPLILTGIIIALLTGLTILGGIKRIAQVTEKMVPFMAVFYVIGSVIIVVANISNLPAAFSMIFAGAFNTRALEGGIMGYVIMKAMRFGVARGVFSNEAGMGSAPIAHAASSEKDPVKQGLWGIFEVFVDTIIICSLTGLVILTSGVVSFAANTGITGFIGGPFSGADLTMAAFSATFGPAGGIFVTIGILLFALSTILGWSYYGQQSLGYLTKNNKTWDWIYKAIFTALTIVGAIGGLTLIWDIADTLNGLMAIPNLIALIILSGVTFNLTKKYFKDGSSL
ncbi:MAG: sodium:alanine symporter family protein [Treponema sp.]|jgi:AGCS family alanine or glycine:cation symporter|nr:sodium:alanine symporter family protein [Treponema sp.]